MYDVIVCGAGPAGATAARTCAERGLRVLLLDAARLPRDKTCAGGLTRAAMTELRDGLPPELAEHSCTTFRAVWLGEVVDVRRDQAYTVAVDRSAFDFWLVQAALRAGARLRDGERLLQLVRRPDSVLAITARGYYRARAVIGCDGVNSIVARSVRGPNGRGSVVLTVSAEIPADDATIARFTGGGLRVEYNAGPVGYRWALPKRGRINIGIGGPATPGRELARHLIATARQNGLAEPRPRFHLIPLGHRDTPVVADNILLAGDAAALADPFTGEGMRWALASGRLAAAVLSDVLARGADPDRSTLAPYSALCAVWRGEFRAAWQLTNLVARCPRLVRRLAFDNEEVFCRLLDVADGTRTHRQYLTLLMLRTPLLALGSARAALGARRDAGEAGV